MENILVPIQNSEEEVMITLPNGRRFPRKVYSKYSTEELKEIIACCNNYTHIIQTLRINNYYHKYLIP